MIIGAYALVRSNTYFFFSDNSSIMNQKMVRESRIDAAKLNKTKAKLKSVGQKIPKEVVKLKA